MFSLPFRASKSVSKFNSWSQHKGFNLPTPWRHSVHHSPTVPTLPQRKGPSHPANLVWPKACVAFLLAFKCPESRGCITQGLLLKTLGFTEGTQVSIFSRSRGCEMLPDKFYPLDFSFQGLRGRNMSSLFR